MKAIRKPCAPAAEPRTIERKKSQVPTVEVTRGADAELRRQGARELENGRSLLTKGSYREAIPFFERALELDPGLAEAHLLLGVCHAKGGNPRQGAYHYEEFVHLRPDDPQSKRALSILRSYYASTDEKPRRPLPE